MLGDGEGESEVVRELYLVRRVGVAASCWTLAEVVYDLEVAESASYIATAAVAIDVSGDGTSLPWVCLLSS